MVSVVDCDRGFWENIKKGGNETFILDVITACITELRSNFAIDSLLSDFLNSLMQCVDSVRKHSGCKIAKRNRIYISFYYLIFSQYAFKSSILPVVSLEMKQQIAPIFDAYAKQLPGSQTWPDVLKAIDQVIMGNLSSHGIGTSQENGDTYYDDLGDFVIEPNAHIELSHCI